MKTDFDKLTTQKLVLEKEIEKIQELLCKKFIKLDAINLKLRLSKKTYKSTAIFNGNHYDGAMWVHKKNGRYYQVNTIYKNSIRLMPNDADEKYFTIPKTSLEKYYTFIG